MTTDATLSAITATRREASSTAWFWWKETRQLAPLAVLLIIVAMLIVVLNTIVGMAVTSLEFRVPNEFTMLVFPGLFATGAGPLLVGQERAQRTIDWLALLPISSWRLATTKLCVGMAGLAVMWVFALFVIYAFDLGARTTSHWMVGRESGNSNNPFTYPVWMTHSLFILLAGFYVAWRIKNQFYSLMTLIPLAFSPFIMTSLVSEVIGRRLLSGEQDWINFGFTLLGIVVVTPLTYRAAMRTLGPAKAPSVTPLLDVSPHSPAKELNDAIAPRFGSQSAPIIWQSIYSAKGLLAILIGMLLVGFFVTMRLASIDHPQGLDRTLSFLLLAPPLAVCWLGVSVFKHDGASERVRFLADRGVSHRKTYFALHAIPAAILCSGLLIYGLWNLTISHRESVSDFAAGLPTLVTMMMFVLLIYSVSQWVSQTVRTLILSVILAPILSLIVVGWLTFSYAALGLPIYGMIICGIIPLVATYLMMQRYMDERDRPSTFILGGFVITLITFLPIGFAAAHVMSVPRMEPGKRTALLAEARRLSSEQSKRPYTFTLNGFSGDYEQWYDRSDDKLEELDSYLKNYSMDPLQIVKPLGSQSDSAVFAHIDVWEYSRWHCDMMRARLRWRQNQDEPAWTALAAWIKASATLLPSLRQSPFMTDQEVADRLEVLVIDTLVVDVPGDRRDTSVVQAAKTSIGTPASRAAARRRAVLQEWLSHLRDDLNQYRWPYLEAMEHQPQGLVDWIEPRLAESLVSAMIEGIDDAADHRNDIRWRQKLHALHQTGGVFETSRYGDAMRSLPAIETMSLRVNGYGQLWGRDWEYIDLDTALEKAQP